jgi:hypothetical protein
VGINVGLDILLIPKYGILGAAIGWAVAIAISNLMPLGQLARVLRLHPFGRGTIIACAISVVNFGLVPLALRTVLGSGPAALAASVAVGGLLQLLCMWRFRRVLHLPGLSRRSPGGNTARSG